MGSAHLWPHLRALICGPVATTGMVENGLGLTGAAKATLVRVWYVAAWRTRPRRPWSPPPNLLWMKVALDLNI